MLLGFDYRHSIIGSQSIRKHTDHTNHAERINTYGQYIHTPHIPFSSNSRSVSATFSSETRQPQTLTRNPVTNLYLVQVPRATSAAAISKINAACGVQIIPTERMGVRANDGAVARVRAMMYL